MRHSQGHPTETPVNRVKVKICGIARAEDGLLASRAGADAIGMVFYGPSPRCVDIPGAREIARAVGPFVTTVALFVNPDRSQVERVIEEVRPRLLQFHGDEPREFCASFGEPYIKAVRVREDTDIPAAVAAHPGAAGFLFDSWSADRYGGTGKAFDWQQVEGRHGFPLILAGGLDADNVADAVARLAPYAVDVSSGVELRPGVKDGDKVRRFIRAAKQIPI